MDPANKKKILPLKTFFIGKNAAKDEAKIAKRQKLGAINIFNFCGQFFLKIDRK